MAFEFLGLVVPGGDGGAVLGVHGWSGWVIDVLGLVQLDVDAGKSGETHQHHSFHPAPDQRRSCLKNLPLPAVSPFFL